MTVTQAPSGQAPYSQDPRLDVDEMSPQELFTRRVPSDPDSLEFKHTIRTITRHWRIIAFLALILPAFIFVYDTALYDFLRKQKLPAWAKVGARRTYASTVTFEHVPPTTDRSLRGILSIYISMESLVTIPERKEFQALFKDRLLTEPELNPVFKALVQDYVDAGLPSASASIHLTPISESVVQCRVRGEKQRLLPILGRKLIPALNSYIKQLRAEGIQEAIEDAKQLIKENEEALDVAWEEMNDNEVLRKQYALIMKGHKLKLGLTELLEKSEYERLAKRFHILKNEDILKVLVAGNPLREKWEKLETQLFQMRIRYHDVHPAIRTVQDEITAIRLQLKRQGGVTSAGRVPPIPKAPVQQVFHSILSISHKIQENKKAIAAAKDLDSLPAQTPERKKTEGTRKENAERHRQSIRYQKKLRAKIEYLHAKGVKTINDKAGLIVQQNRVQRRNEFKIVAGPAVPEQIGPRLGLDMSMAFIIGIVLGISVAFLNENMDNHLHSPTDVYYHLRLNHLGIIPFWKDQEAQLINPDHLHSPIGEVYAHLCNNIQFGSTGSPEKRLLVASAIQGEGKSTISVNLAIRYAVEGNTVLLIDADMRRPRGAKLLINHRTAEGGQLGISEYLARGASFNEVITKTDIPSLHFIPSGTTPPNPTRLLRSPRMSDLLEKAETQFDVVILDCPAILPVVDGTILAPLMHGVLMVVAAEQTEIGAALMALYRLQHVGAQLVGSVLNKARGETGSYRYYGLDLMQEPSSTWQQRESDENRSILLYIANDRLQSELEAVLHLLELDSDATFVRDESAFWKEISETRPAFVILNAQQDGSDLARCKRIRKEIIPGLGRIGMIGEPDGPLSIKNQYSPEIVVHPDLMKDDWAEALIQHLILSCSRDL